MRACVCSYRRTYVRAYVRTYAGAYIYQALWPQCLHKMSTTRPLTSHLPASASMATNAGAPPPGFYTDPRVLACRVKALEDGLAKTIKLQSDITKAKRKLKHPFTTYDFHRLERQVRRITAPAASLAVREARTERRLQRAEERIEQLEAATDRAARALLFLQEKGNEAETAISAIVAREISREPELVDDSTDAEV